MIHLIQLESGNFYLVSEKIGKEIHLYVSTTDLMLLKKIASELEHDLMIIYKDFSIEKITVCCPQNCSPYIHNNAFYAYGTFCVLLQDISPLTINFAPNKIRGNFKKIRPEEPWLRGTEVKKIKTSKSCSWLGKKVDLTPLLEIPDEDSDNEDCGNFTTMITSREFVSHAQVEELMQKKKKKKMTSDDTLVLAPSENQKPLDIWMDKYSEELSRFNIVAESGFSKKSELEMYKTNGIDLFLIGESLLKGKL